MQPRFFVEAQRICLTIEQGLYMDEVVTKSGCQHSRNEAWKTSNGECEDMSNLAHDFKSKTNVDISKGDSWLDYYSSERELTLTLSPSFSPKQGGSNQSRNAHDVTPKLARDFPGVSMS